MKKIVGGDVLKVGAIIVLLFLCCLPLLLRKSSGTVSRSFFDGVYEDVQGYYSSIKNEPSDQHDLRVSITYDELASRAKFLRENESAGLASYNKNNSIHDVFVDAKSRFPGSGQANMLTGYINTRKTVDAAFKRVKSANQGNLTVNIKDKEPEYYVYSLAPTVENGKTKSYLQKARDVKQRVEDLILVYQVTREPRYLAALKREIVEASKWDNYWQTSQYIDTAEIAYAVSLGYDYAYKTLPDSQKNVIENRLLESVLYYGISKASAALNKSLGNFNQVGHSGAGIVALTLINSSGNERIRVLAVEKDGITIAYPVKKMEGGKVTYSYERTLLLGSNGKKTGPAKITDPDLCALLKDKIQTSNGNRYIPLRTYYAAVIAKTASYLPNVLKTGNIYVDGSYPEGKDYYLYGMKYFSYYLATLRNTFPNTFKSRYYDNLLSFERYNSSSRDALNNIVLNPVYIASANGRNLDYGDAKRNAIEHEDDMFYLANLNAEFGGYEDSAKVVYDYRKRTESKWKLYGIVWYNESHDAKSSKIDYDKVFSDAIYNNSRVINDVAKTKNSTAGTTNLAVSAFRSSYTDTKGVFVAMKGGKNNYNHAHLDLGSFVYYAMGTEWIVDAGSQYDGIKYHDRNCARWQYYVTRAEAHSTIVVKKPGTYTSKDFGTCVAADQWVYAEASFDKIESSDNSGFSEVILTDAYNRTNNDSQGSGTNLNTVRRGLKLFNHKKYVLVEDVVSVTTPSYYSFLNINKGIKATIIDNGQAALLFDGKNYAKIILKSNANLSSVRIKLKTVKEATGGKGVLNDALLNTYGNSKVSLKTNVSRMKDMYGGDASKRQERLVVHAENIRKDANGQERQSSALINMTIGVFIVPLNGDKYATIDEDLLKLSDPHSWYIPSAPKIKITSGGSEIHSGDTISSGAVIEIEPDGQKKANEVIKYSLDSGKTWHVYDGSEIDEVRRTYLKTGDNTINVWAVVDDGTGIQSNTAKVSNFKFNISSNSGSSSESSSSPSFELY